MVYLKIKQDFLAAFPVLSRACQVIGHVTKTNNAHAPMPYVEFNVFPSTTS